MAMSSPRILKFLRSVEPSSYCAMSNWSDAERPCGLVQPILPNSELGLGEVGLHAQACAPSALRATERVTGSGPFNRCDDLEPEGLARRLVERGADPDRRLAVVRLVENALPGKLGGHALDQNLTARVERLLGDVHVERAALDADIADNVRGDGLVEPRFAAELDVLEFEVLAHRHVEHEVASGGAAESSGFMPTACI